MTKTDITGVCLNPCIDRALTIDGFEYGGTNRVVSQVDYAGGKGFNVAVAATKLGLSSAATGFLYEDNGDIILRALEKENVDIQTLSFPGNVRVNLKVYDKATEVITELNGKGKTMDANAMEQMAEKTNKLSKTTEYMVFGGSVSPGLSHDIYKQLIETANKNNCKCVLDAEGELLRQGLKAKPFMIKPNHFELEMLVGKGLGSIEEIKEAAVEIVEQGVGIVLVSLGKDGAMIVSKDGAKYAKGLKVHVKNTVGAGDTMVSGAVKGLIGGGDIGEVLRQAAAAATCSIMQEGTGLSDTSKLKEIYDKITVTDI